MRQKRVPETRVPKKGKGRIGTLSFLDKIHGQP